MYTRAYSSRMCRTSLSASSYPNRCSVSPACGSPDSGFWCLQGTCQPLEFCSKVSAIPPLNNVTQKLRGMPYLGRIRAVALLPQELARADERRGLLKLPAHHIGPLVQPQRQVAVAADPLRASQVRFFLDLALVCPALCLQSQARRCTRRCLRVASQHTRLPVCWPSYQYYADRVSKGELQTCQLFNRCREEALLRAACKW